MNLDNRVGTPHTHTNGVVESHPAPAPIDTQHQNRRRKTWRQALQESVPLLLLSRTMP